MLQMNQILCGEKNQRFFLVDLELYYLPLLELIPTIISLHTLFLEAIFMVISKLVYIFNDNCDEK